MMLLRQNDDIINMIEKAMIDSGDTIDCPLVHDFIDGFYMRTVMLPKGTIVTSRVHKTEHPFFVLQGHVLVSVDAEEWDDIYAFSSGITKAGTRRVVQALEDTVWMTIHPNKDNCKDISVLENRLVEPHLNELLTNKMIDP